MKILSIRQTISTIILLLCGVGANAALDPTLTVGPAEEIYTNINTTNFGYDMAASTLRINSTELYFWIENGDSIFKKFRGTLAEPFKTAIWTDPSGRWNMNGFPASGQNRYRPWLANVYKVSETELIGFVHVETDDWDAYATITFHQGIGYSSDGGDHWTYCGDVVRAQQQQLTPNTAVNMGGCPIIVNGDYIYQYFNDRHQVSGYTHTVARSRIADIVAAARAGTVSAWYKYYNGTWTEPGMNGKSTDLFSYDMHTDAVWCAPLGKYLIALRNTTTKGIALGSSTDGVTWGNITNLYTPAAGGDCPYPFFAGLDPGASDDCNTVGGSFYMYFPDRNNLKVFRIPFTVTKLNTPVITPNSGTFASSIMVTITTSSSGATIRYTTNGSDPTLTSTEYTAPFAIDGNTIVKAKVFKGGWTDSNLAAASYTIEARILVYPNPATLGTTGTVKLGNIVASSTIKIYDSIGGLVTTLISGTSRGNTSYAGGLIAYWDGTNESNQKVAAGIYYTVSESPTGALRKGKIAITK